MNSGQSDATGIPGHMHSLVRRALTGSAVYCAIYAAAIGASENFLEREFRFESCISANAQRQFATVAQGFDCPDSAYLECAKCGDSHEADRSSTNDRDIFICSNRRQAERVESNRERLSECCLREGH